MGTLAETQALASASLAAIDPNEAERELALLGAHLDAAMQRQLLLIRTIDETGHWVQQGALSCAHWLNWRIGLDLGAARERVRVARALVALPAIDDALRRGEVSYSKVRAMTRVATAANEAKLLDMARHSTASQLERICRGVRRQRSADSRDEAPVERWLRLRHRGEPTVRIEGDFLPDEGERVMEALRVVRARMTVEHGPAARPNLADALVRLADGILAGDRVGESIGKEQAPDAAVIEEHANAEHASAEHASAEHANAEHASAETAAAEAAPVAPRAETPTPTRSPSRTATRTSGADRADVLIHFAPSALSEGVLSESYGATMEDGGYVSAETLRRLFCDCGLIGIVKDARGDVLDIGRKTRRIPPALRRAVMARDRRCTFPGCTHDRFVELHHPEEWVFGGATALYNLCALCTFHHALVHEGGWRVEMVDGRTPVFFRPDGTQLDAVCTPPPAPADPLAAFEAQQAALGIHEETGLTRWDGTPPDYHACIHSACVADDEPRPRRRREYGLDEEELARPAIEWLAEHGYA